MNPLLDIPDTAEHRELLKAYLSRKQTFQEYMNDPSNPPKKYLDIRFSVHFLCYKQPRATYEALKSLRQFYPDVAVRLISDGGDDFSRIARHFDCEYTYARINAHRPGARKPFEYSRRVQHTCKMFNTPWIVLMEDDVRVRDRISKHPNAYIAGPSGPEYSSQVCDYLRRKHPSLEINGYNGCGGCIFHREAFLAAYERIGEIKKLPLEMDRRIHQNADALLTFIFLNAGYVARRWLDHSEELGAHHGPASAFDHQFKQFYNQPKVTLPEHSRPRRSTSLVLPKLSVPGQKDTQIERVTRPRKIGREPW